MGGLDGEAVLVRAGQMGDHLPGRRDILRLIVLAELDIGVPRHRQDVAMSGIDAADVGVVRSGRRGAEADDRRVGLGISGAGVHGDRLSRGVKKRQRDRRAIQQRRDGADVRPVDFPAVGGDDIQIAVAVDIPDGQVDRSHIGGVMGVEGHRSGAVADQHADRVVPVAEIIPAVGRGDIEHAVSVQVADRHRRRGLITEAVPHPRTESSVPDSHLHGDPIGDFPHRVAAAYRDEVQTGVAVEVG